MVTKELFVAEVKRGFQERNKMTSLLDRPITAASDACAAGTLPSCGRHARNYWN